MPKTKALCISIFFASCVAVAQDWRSYQTRLETVAKDTSPAVLSITDARDMMAQVRGSAFLINDDGYFLTAAHVLSEANPEAGDLKVSLPQKNRAGAIPQMFDVIEKDERLDAALCRIQHFEAIKKAGNFEFGVLGLSIRNLPVGHLVLIAGFPLGSGNVTIQAGHIGATYSIVPQAVRPGGGPMGILFQVSVAGNQGDSGGPVIDLETGKVVGIVVRVSLNAAVAQTTTIQSTGLIYALPISHVSDLLSKHHIQTKIPRSNAPAKRGGPQQQSK